MARSTIPLLSKRDYLDGLHCAKRLYLTKYEPEMATGPDEGALARMQDGDEIARLARGLFPEGVAIDSFGAAGLTATKIALQEARTIFDAQIEANGRTARIDVMQSTPGGWRIYDAVSAKVPKPDEAYRSRHLNSLSFQISVLCEVGLHVEGAHLILLSREYRRGVEARADLSQLFVTRDVSDKIEKLLQDTHFRSIAMLETLAKEEPPKVAHNVHCQGCDFFAYCVGDLPDDDLIYLPGIRRQQVTHLRRQGVKSIGEIPDEFDLTVSQRTAWSAVQQGKPYLSDKLRGRLEALRYPAFFVDFETTSWAVPTIPQTEAYEAIPFQWSCHVLRTADSDPEHYDFLATTSDDPREEFALTLLERIKGAASIVTYSAYEQQCLSWLAGAGVPFGRELCDLFAARSVDLLAIVRDCTYWPGFRGSFSLKSVLPAVIPGFGYDDLAIQEGYGASLAYKRMVSPLTQAPQAAQISRDLRAYCERDTLVMVELYRELCRQVGIGPAQAGPIGGQLVFNL